MNTEQKTSAESGTSSIRIGLDDPPAPGYIINHKGEAVFGDYLNYFDCSIEEAVQEINKRDSIFLYIKNKEEKDICIKLPINARAFPSLLAQFIEKKYKELTQ